MITQLRANFENKVMVTGDCETLYSPRYPLTSYTCVFDLGCFPLNRDGGLASLTEVMLMAFRSSQEHTQKKKRNINREDAAEYPNSGGCK